jgi:hypothetical protein
MPPKLWQRNRIGRRLLFSTSTSVCDYGPKEQGRTDSVHCNKSSSNCLAYSLIPATDLLNANVEL